MLNHELLCELLYLKLKDLNRDRYLYRRNYYGHPDTYEITRAYPEEQDLPEAEVIIEDIHIDEICDALVNNWCPQLGLDLSKLTAGVIEIEATLEKINVRIRTGDIWMCK